MGERTEELLGTTSLLDNLDDSGLQLLNGGNVVGQDTHFTGLGGNVDLNDVLGVVDGLIAVISMESARNSRNMSIRARGWSGSRGIGRFALQVIVSIVPGEEESSSA